MAAPIVPYPGLRPFTEEESIFFKGRDGHIKQIIGQLQEKKILMLTGASGDGKSSLVYAGVIPNARAGFFKSKHNNWRICAFRPEKSPLRNLADALAEALELEPESTLAELRYGFSALTDLYTASGFHHEEREGDGRDAQALREAKNKACNLFILADQFEEFFTNAENLANGKPSRDAYTAVNLLLETGRLALERNLPIYVVCTMRSDFIGQCPAFKGLPEMLGFSHFFVPRLGRKELRQVIEEPARLGGGAIAPRLVELLTNEVREGVDQLPLLQHALNRLWKEADNGGQTIDFAHLARLGGLPPHLLAERERQDFELWLERQPKLRRALFENPSFPNVLNAHANELFQNAHLHAQENAPWAQAKVSAEQAQQILKVAFQCLTKIDDGRAVRHRMTLDEITRVVDLEGVSAAVVCGVLNIFRVQDNTFVQPFAHDDIESQYLPGHTVMDITHEALIRNWALLQHWGKEESDKVESYKDFRTQLVRWQENQEAKSYLLPLGPLSFFEEWHRRSSPNAQWYAKYDSRELPAREKLVQNEALHQDTLRYLAASRQRIDALAAAQRRRRMAAVAVALLVIATLSGFTFWAMQEKNEADNQRAQAGKNLELAEQQRLLAEAKAQELELSQAATEEQKTLAEANARDAMRLKGQSDSLLLVAQALRRLAEAKGYLAERSANDALTEKGIAEIKRQEAEAAQMAALMASEDARKQGYLAMAQALTYKSRVNFEDKQVNLLLALHAYKFHTQNGGNPKDASIYQALLNAWQISGHPNLIDHPNNLYIGNRFAQDEMVGIERDGEVWRTRGELTERLAQLGENTPINQAFVLSDRVLLTCHEDKSLNLWTVQGGKAERQRLSGHEDFVRCASVSPDSALLATGGRDGQLNLWSLENPERRPVYTWSVAPARVTSAHFLADGRLVLTDSKGTLWLKEPGQDPRQLDKAPVGIHNSFLSEELGLLAVNLEDGKVWLYDAASLQKRESLDVGTARVEVAAFDERLRLVAFASADKKIKVFDATDFNRVPILITDHEQKVSFLYFESSQLKAICYDNSLRFWDMDTERLAKAMKGDLRRDLDLDEWQRYIGDGIPFETLYQP